MKKLISSLGLLTFLGLSAFVNAQTGINSTTPKSTLDINAKTDNKANDIEGLLIPRVSKNKAFLMGVTVPISKTLP